MRYGTLPLLIIALLLVPAAAPGQTMTAPAFVQATGDGSFSYTVEMVYPETGALFGGYEVRLTANIDGYDQMIDGFCTHHFDAYTLQTFVVEGQLADPSFEGTVTFRWFCCDPVFEEVAVTTVLVPAVADEYNLWGAVKALYR